MDDKLKSTPYTIIPITNDVKDRVVNFLRKFFFRDEPLNMAVGLLDEPNANCTELEEYCLACIPNGKLFIPKQIQTTFGIELIILNNIIFINSPKFIIS